MAIRFKFRSSANFDSIDIGGQPSIAVRDLRSKILRNKNLISQDFDLVFSDALTGQEYGDENHQILSGSSIIVKRVPAGSAPAPSPRIAIDSVGKHEHRVTGLVRTTMVNPMNAEGDDFDDFGVELSPVPKVISYDSVHESDKVNCINNEKMNFLGPRCSKPTFLRCQKLEASDLSEAFLEGPTHSKAKREALNTHTQQGVLKSNHPAEQSSDLPSELKCSLCNNFFKEAVMIPCCQHSFCSKCIHLVLVEKQRCPRCFSTKCRVEDLLPNVSLRQAIEHFLESQNFIDDSENALHRYAPDEESGIQAKDVSCAATVHQREPDVPHSFSVTERRHNQKNVGSMDKSMNRNNVIMGGPANSLEAGFSSLKSKHINAGLYGPRPLNFKQSLPDSAVDEFQGENQPLNLPMHDEADSTAKKKKGSWMHPSGGDRSFAANDRHGHRKGGRSCYTCGSYDHLMRDCPAASGPYPSLQTGDAMFPGSSPGFFTCWNAVALSHMRPFQNIYSNLGMVPSNNFTTAPTQPFLVPSYLPPMYGSLPVPGGFMRMGCLPPSVRTTNECFMNRLRFSELQDWKAMRCENHQREQSIDGEGGNFNKQYEPERSHFHKSRVDKKGVIDSEETLERRSKRKHMHDNYSYHDNCTVEGRDYWRPCPAGGSNSGTEDRPYCSSLSDEERHNCHSRGSKKHVRRIGHGDSDSSQCHNQMKDKKDVKRTVGRASAKTHHLRDYKHSDSGSEPSLPCQPIKQHKERETLGSRHSRHGKHLANHELIHDRWQMNSGYEDHRGDHHHKRKRVH